MEALGGSSALLSFNRTRFNEQNERKRDGFALPCHVDGRGCGTGAALAGQARLAGLRWRSISGLEMRPGRKLRGRNMMPALCRASGADREALAGQLGQWLQDNGFPDQAVTLKDFGDEGLGCATKVPLKPGDVALRVPEKYTVTSVDVAAHPVIASLAAGRGDLIGLTLWCMYERYQAQRSSWYPFLSVFPESTLSPLLWSPEERKTLLAGSPVLEEVKQRLHDLEGAYAELRNTFEKDPEVFPDTHFSLEAFKLAFSVVLSRAIYLPTVDVFALVPYADAVNHRGDCNAYLDFSVEDQAVVLKVDRSYKVGEQVFVTYGSNRPNSDILISYGFVDEANNNDYVELEVGLVAADGLRPLKQQIVDAAGLGVTQKFPLFTNRFPTQLLTYMRLVRVQDPALFAKINFEKDIILDQANEYEVLMLLMGECRTRLAGYQGGIDEEIRLLKEKLSPKQRVAAQLRLAEQKIYSNTMGALRNRLAPIRGIPTKGGGLKDPNSDIKEMFDMVEQVASAPAKLFSKLFQK